MFGELLTYMNLWLSPTNWVKYSKIWLSDSFPLNIFNSSQAVHGKMFEWFNFKSPATPFYIFIYHKFMMLLYNEQLYLAYKTLRLDITELIGFGSSIVLSCSSYMSVDTTQISFGMSNVLLFLFFPIYLQFLNDITRFFSVVYLFYML